MDKILSCLETLNSQHENFKSESVNIGNLVKSIEFYEAFIPDFFSKNGEAEGIKSVYRGIAESLDDQKTIVCTDINRSSIIYNEYMEGMSDFIRDIFSTIITESKDELSEFKTKFEKAKKMDSVFIESLYDGRLNEKVEMVLSDAVSNLEFLIDFIPQMKVMKESCITLHESYNSETDEQKKTLIDNSLNMLYESVDNYCYNTIKNIVTTYTDICDKLFNEQVDDHSGEENNSFKLF